MPWQEVVTVELRQQFVQDARRRVVPVTELCAAYGISRKTGYKFLTRYDTLGAAGLEPLTSGTWKCVLWSDPPGLAG
jgi:putative transposase